ncbi:MAG: NRDE family protein [Ferruginibacter sp.]
MCTVSFVSAKDRIIITSNRDEHIQRQTAAAPDFEMMGQKKIIFPKDAKAGGTWFAAASNATVVVLLNGAFVKHTPVPPYRKSRGLILLDIIEAENPYMFFKNADLLHIEPFTVILYQPATLYELRWDGNDKHEKLLDVSGNYIWSSATLYTNEIIAERKEKFDQFVHVNDSITAGSIFDFHNSNQGDAENGFIINRDTGMKTFSITQAIISKDLIDFYHTDLLQDRQYEEILPVNSKFKSEKI